MKISQNETGITCKTFCNRLYRCSEFREKETYVKTSRLLFERILKNYDISSDVTLLDIFVDEFKNRAFTGIRVVYPEHQIDYKQFCLKCIINLDTFFIKFKPTRIMHSYNYKHKIKGKIGCRIKGFNVHFFYENSEYTQKELDFVSLNNYIYNQVHGLSNAAMAMSVPTNAFFLIDYKESDYTMGRGFLTQTKRSQIKRRGPYCNDCKNSCNYLYLNGLDRLSAHL